jgi:hypothetical protein
MYLEVTYVLDALFLAKEVSNLSRATNVIDNIGYGEFTGQWFI